MNGTVIQHVLSRLREVGIGDVFGVAGDYLFPVSDAICADPNLRWIGCCNELNAAYAADGYARIKGTAALCTTYGVGELSAINGIAGAYAEHLPVFHLVGMPSSRVQASHRIVHHTLGDGAFDCFYKMTEPVVCARAILTPENCIADTERLIAAALEHRRPVYMGFPSDYVEATVSGNTASAQERQGDCAALKAAMDAIVGAVSASNTACILPGILVSRYGLTREVTDLINASGLPFATMFMDKSVLDESHPSYIGIYDGKLMNEEVRAFVEDCDLVLGIGMVMTDFNSGVYTAKLNPSKTINIMPNSVMVGNAVYKNIALRDVVTALVKAVPQKRVRGPMPVGLGIPVGAPDDAITSEYLYPRWENMLNPGDILITETGNSSMGLAFARMPAGATFQNQTLWGSIGWATPAAFGAALAAPERRIILVTGEGSHQLTVQEISQFHRHRLKPIIFVHNNKGYTIERLLCEDPEICYNDIPQWHYEKIPEALGCDDWFSARVTTCGELDAAITTAEVCGTGAYIEVVTGKYAAPPLAQKIGEALGTLYTQ